MTLSLRVEEEAEGFVAHCQSTETSFSFLIGQDELSTGQVRGNHLFVTRGSHAPYMLQFVHLELSAELASLPEEQDLEALATHYGWERDFQAKAGTQVMEDASLVSSELRDGKLLIAWNGDTPEGLQSSTNKPEGLHPSTEQALPTTPFTGFASIRNRGELLLFSVQGLGESWSREGVRAKAMRIALSTCFGAVAKPGA